MNILDKIIAHKRIEVAEAKSKISKTELEKKRPSSVVLLFHSKELCRLKELRELFLNSNVNLPPKASSTIVYSPKL